MPSLLFPRLMPRLAGTVPLPMRKLLVGGRGGFGGTADRREGARWNGAAGDAAREPEPAGESVRFALEDVGSCRECEVDRDDGALSSTTTLERGGEQGQRPSTFLGARVRGGAPFAVAFALCLLTVAAERKRDLLERSFVEPGLETGLVRNGRDGLEVARAVDADQLRVGRFGREVERVRDPIDDKGLRKRAGGSGGGSRSAPVAGMSGPACSCCKSC